MQDCLSAQIPCASQVDPATLYKASGDVENLHNELNKQQPLFSYNTGNATQAREFVLALVMSFSCGSTCAGGNHQAGSICFAPAMQVCCL